MTSKGYGLGKLDYLNHQFKTFTKKDGLADDITHLILPDQKNNLWISGRMGLSRFNEITSSITPIQLDEKLYQDFYDDAAKALPDGSLVFSSKRSLLHFHPANIKDTTYLPLVFMGNNICRLLLPW